MQSSVQSKKNRIMSTLLLLTAMSVLFLYNWTAEAVDSAHVMPATAQKDINGLINKAITATQLSKAEIHLLSEQTGLSEATIQEMLHSGHVSELLFIHNIYFASVTIEEIRTTPLTISEWLAEDPLPGYGGMPMVDIQNGDILITKNSRFLGWRNGHAGLVVDAENGLILEAIMLGSPSQLCNISKWESYPSFLVLRLREEFMLPEDNDEVQCNTTVTDVVVSDSADTTAENVAAYASQHLVGVPYQLLAGVFSRELYRASRERTRLSTGATISVPDTASNVPEIATEVLSGTQCAHLVWYAYKQFGIDLDSDGGLFVTPYDIQNSPYLEIVQSYGY